MTFQTSEDIYDRHFRSIMALEIFPPRVTHFTYRFINRFDPVDPSPPLSPFRVAAPIA